MIPSCILVSTESAESIKIMKHGTNRKHFVDGFTENTWDHELAPRLILVFPRNKFTKLGSRSASDRDVAIAVTILGKNLKFWEYESLRQKRLCDLYFCAVSTLQMWKYS